jgi:hypothetical protein
MLVLQTEMLARLLDLSRVDLRTRTRVLLLRVVVRVRDLELVVVVAPARAVRVRSTVHSLVLAPSSLVESMP